MKYRSHGGGTVWDWPVTELEPTMAALRAHLKVQHSKVLHLMPDLSLLEVKPYIEGQKAPDDRIGWDDTLLVILRGYGVMGYVDRMPSIIEPGDVVLIGGSDLLWRDCLLLVEEVRSWGVIGSVTAPQQTIYPMRVALDNILTVYKKVSDEDL